VKRGKTNEGMLVEVSLLESALDLQFEVITTHLNDGRKHPKRAKHGNAHAYLSAPYGIYKTKNGFIAMAMEDLHKIGKKIGSPELLQYAKEEWFSKRDEIMKQLNKIFQKKTTDD